MKQQQIWPAEEQEAFKQKTRQQYEQEGNAFYATARLWDDGIIDPAQTRQVLGLSLITTLQTSIKETNLYGIFRM